MSCTSCIKANEAAKRGHLVCLQDISSKPRFTWNSKDHKGAAILASRYGHLECLKFSHQRGCPLDDISNLEVGEYIIEKDIVNASIIDGHLDCLRYAHQKAGVELTEDAFIVASVKGHLNCIEYLHQQALEWYSGTIAICARYGNLVCLKYAYENGAPYEKENFDIQDEEGNGQIVDCSPETIASAYGRLDCLKYLCSKDPLQHLETIEFAIQYKHLECARYLIEQEFPCVVTDHWIYEGRLSYQHLDDPVWRDFLFNKAILSKAPSVQRLVNQKKSEIEQTKKACMCLFSENKIPEDIVKYILYVYF